MMETIRILLLIGVVICLVVKNSELKSQPQQFTSCERCGATGDTEGFTGLPNHPNFYHRPLNLCSKCRNAQINFLEERFMLETERRLHFGRSGLVNAVQKAWGNQAVDILALLRVAHKDMDMARRIFDKNSFETVRPWLEQNLRQSGE